MASIMLRHVESVSTSELIRTVAKRLNIPIREVDIILNEIIVVIEENLMEGKAVKIDRLATFYVFNSKTINQEYTTVKAQISTVLKSKCRNAKIKWKRYVTNYVNDDNSKDNPKQEELSQDNVNESNELNELSDTDNDKINVDNTGTDDYGSYRKLNV